MLESSAGAASETALDDAEMELAGGAENDFGGAQLETPGCSDGRGAVNLSGAQFLPGAGLVGTGPSRYDPKRGQREVADVAMVRRSCSTVSSAVGRQRRQARGAHVVSPEAGGKRTGPQCAEAGSFFDSHDLVSIRVESRVFDA